MHTNLILKPTKKKHSRPGEWTAPSHCADAASHRRLAMVLPKQVHDLLCESFNKI